MRSAPSTLSELPHVPLHARIEHVLRTTLADEELARALGLTEGAPVLRIDRLTHDAEGQPIDFEYLYFRADTLQYRLRIDRQRAGQG